MIADRKLEPKRFLASGNSERNACYLLSPALNRMSYLATHHFKVTSMSNNLMTIPLAIKL